MKTYKNWNIKGIAESVIREIKEDRDAEDRTDEEKEEYLEDVLDHYIQEVYWSIHSRDMKSARIVAELVREYIEEIEGLS
ncbi:MAG: hypothetical protein A2X59_05260 [Nitrospirae bacterium GWC2_42_7]|nr:MAG: hypothetical protein A2X59_05260 [Nitrospirae bacterium GWC2_42_7]